MSSDPTELQNFAYSPLAAGEIRVLVPNSADGLSWTLKVSDLTDLNFDALSYCWGPQVETFPIRCNDHQLRVHHNLHTALPYLARRQLESIPAQPIWVDAVCINQADDAEKFIQINTMNQIYKRARKVWAWLGLAKDQTHMPRVLSLLPLIVNYDKIIKGFPDASLPDIPEELRIVDFGFWNTVLHVLRNPWYERVWVLQEVALARDLAFVCGRHEIDAALLKEATLDDTLGRWLLQDSEGQRIRLGHTLVTYHSILLVRDLYAREHRFVDKTVGDPSSQWNLLRVVLSATYNLQCSSPQDRVFGLLGLVKEMESESFTAQSYASISELYTHFSRYILSVSEHDFRWWDYFNASFTHTRRNGLPSWVPDLHFQNSEHVTSSCRNVRRLSVNGVGVDRFEASTAPVVFELGARSDEIVIHGKILDKVRLTHPIAPTWPAAGWELREEADYVAPWIAMNEWLDEITSRALPSSYNAEVNLNHADKYRVSTDTFWRTLVADTRGSKDYDQKFTEESWHEFRGFLKLLTLVMKRKWERQRLIDIGDLPSEIPVEDMYTAEEVEMRKPEMLDKLDSGFTISFMTNILRVSRRRFFNTLDGKFGFTMPDVQPGDIVCVLNGSPTPHVIRRVDDRDSQERYKFVGDAYVHGLMHGEVDKMAIEARKVTFV